MIDNEPMFRDLASVISKELQNEIDSEITERMIESINRERIRHKEDIKKWFDEQV